MGGHRVTMDIGRRNISKVCQLLSLAPRKCSRAGGLALEDIYISMLGRKDQERPDATSHRVSGPLLGGPMSNERERIYA